MLDQVLDRRGNYLREWGRSGIAPRTFDSPSAIVLEPKNELLYVVDTKNYRLQVFDRDGELAKKAPDGRVLTNPIGSLGSGWEFNTPKDVALDRKANIYVADTGNNRIQKFDPSGKFILEWGRFARKGRGVELNTPVSVAYSEEGFGYIFVLNAPECRILKYELDGTLAAEWQYCRPG